MGPSLYPNRAVWAPACTLTELWPPACTPTELWAPSLYPNRAVAPSLYPNRAVAPSLYPNRAVAPSLYPNRAPLNRGHRGSSNLSQFLVSPGRTRCWPSSEGLTTVLTIVDLFLKFVHLVALPKLPMYEETGPPSPRPNPRGPVCPRDPVLFLFLEGLLLLYWQMGKLFLNVRDGNMIPECGRWGKLFLNAGDGKMIPESWRWEHDS